MTINSNSDKAARETYSKTSNATVLEVTESGNHGSDIFRLANLCEDLGIVKALVDANKTAKTADP